LVRKIVEKVPATQLQQDLEKYRERALELGATDAKVITTDMVVIDERVRMKCLYPKCYYYGTSAHCPPHAFDLDMARKTVEKFQYALFFCLVVPSYQMAGTEALEKRLYIPPHRKIFKLVSMIESEAFSDGYYLSFGLGCGPCKEIFCPKLESSLLIVGKGCHQPLKSRTSMEGFGIDVFTLAAKVGWDIYPIGAATSPGDIPCGGIYVLVFIY